MASNKPPIVQAAVMAKYVNGESKRQIAEDLSMSRTTVDTILGDAELSQIVLRGKADVYRMIPLAVDGLRKAIKRGKTTEEAQLVLRSTGVLAPEQSGSPSVNVNFGVFGGE